MVFNNTNISDFIYPLTRNNVFWLILAIATLVGGVAAVGYFIEKWQQRKCRAVLTFNIGLISSTQDVEKVLKKATISTLIYGANVPQNSDVAFACPYLMMNNSKLPIYNIILQLEYMSKHVVKNEEKIRGEKQVIKIEEKIIETYLEMIGMPEKYREMREVQIFDSRAQIRFTIPVLRPGEKMVIADPMKFTNIRNNEVFDDGEYSINKELIKKLKKIKKLNDLCIVDAFVYSESCPPLSKRIKLFWFDTNSTKELKLVIEDVVMAFWSGKWPKPGGYLGPPSLSLRKKHISTKEYAEVVIPELDIIKPSKNKSFCWENPLNSKRTGIVLNMPPWNYFQLSGIFETDDLVKASGFIGPISLNQIYRELINKVRLWKYLKRLKK